MNCEFEFLDLYRNITFIYAIESKTFNCVVYAVSYGSPFGVVKSSNIGVFKDGFNKFEIAVNNA